MIDVVGYVGGGCGFVDDFLCLVFGVDEEEVIVIVDGVFDEGVSFG